MNTPLPIIAVRSSSGIQLNSCSSSSHELIPSFTKDASRTCRAMAMSQDGKLFAWANDQKVMVVTLPDCKEQLNVSRPKTLFLEFSPLGNILVSWEYYSANRDNPQLSSNLHLWDVKSGKCLRSFIQKKQTGWCPQWNDDESISARHVSNEVHFFEKNNFDEIVHKIHLQKVHNFSLSPQPSPSYVTCYIPGINGQPSFVRLYKYPKFEGNTAIVGSKSFFRADGVEMKWNLKGTGVLIMTTTDVDKTGASYYGEQKLHFMTVNGDSSVVQLAKNGPVYSAEWNPNSTEFCVVYGFMPAKATLFNLKCEPTFDFGTGPRNAVYYNCFGNMLILGGFGNLRGNIEVWDLKRLRLISKFQASDSTKLEWFADGEHFFTATTSPRLRVGNGYKLWNYTGKMLLDHKWEDKEELYDVIWQRHPPDTFQQKQISYSLANTQTTEPAQQVYRPPGARGQPSTFKLQENEPPSNMKKQDAPMSKSALKNKKKRDAKKAKKEQGQETTIAPVVESKTITPVEGKPKPIGVEGEKEKKIKNLQKKLDQIKKLKALQSSGKTLELNQVEKIKKEDEVLKELRQLQL